jgi:HEAT repeat protein
LAKTADHSLPGEIADLLASGAAPREQAVPTLIQFLPRDDFYIVHGDFYGNGGERRIVGDRAADALVALRASDALAAQLQHPEAAAKIRAVRALSSFGATALTPDLLNGVNDPDHRVRRETVATLGRIGDDDPTQRQKLQATLRRAFEDRHRSVREIAKETLARWGME